MDFFKEFQKKQQELQKQLEKEKAEKASEADDTQHSAEEKTLEQVIKETFAGNLNLLKERITISNYDDHYILVDGIDRYRPLEYAIFVENMTAAEYFLSMKLDLDDHRNLSDVCEKITSMNMIKKLTGYGIDFNSFRYPLRVYDLPDSLSLRFNRDERDKELSFYTNLIHKSERGFSDSLLQELDEFGIAPSTYDFYTPLEMSIVSYKMTTIKRLLKNTDERLEDLLSLAIACGFHEEMAMELIKLFVDEKGVSLNSRAIGKSPLFLEIISRYPKPYTDLMFEVFSRLDSYEGHKEVIYKRLTNDQIAKLDGFEMPAEERIFVAKSYDEVSECLKQVSKLDRPILNHILFEDRIAYNERIKLLDEYLELGGDINILFEDKDLTDGATNHNVLTSAILRIKTSKGMDELVTELLNRGALIEQNGYSALFPATYMNKPSLVKLLLESGANPHFQQVGDDDVIVDALYLWNHHEFISAERIAIMNLLLKAGLDVDKVVDVESEKMTILERIFQISKNDRYVEMHLFENNIGNFTVGSIPNDLLVSLSVTTEQKKKVIDLVPNYEYYVKEYERSENILDTLTMYKLDAKQLDELINYVLDNYPSIKLTGQKNQTSINTKFQVIKQETFIKLLKANQHLMSRIFTAEDLTQPRTLLHTFVLSVGFKTALKSKQGREEIIEVVDTYVELGVDINKPLMLLDKDPKWQSDSNGLLNEIVWEMGEHCGEIHFDILECLHKNGLKAQLPVGAMQESALALFHRYPNGRLSENQHELISIFEFFDEKEGIDIEQKNKFNDTLLLAYSKSGFYEVVEWLLNKGANIHAIGGFDNSPALHKAISNYPDVPPLNRAKTVEILLEHGAKVEEYCNADQFTPLMSAAHYGTKECVKVLLKAGANPNVVSAENLTPVICAVRGDKAYDFSIRPESNQSDILKMLVEYGADINFTPDELSFTPLMFAILNGKKEIFETMLDLGANINMQEPQLGRTPLMIAVEYGDMYFVNSFMRLGADFTQPNNFDENVLTSCIFRNDEMGIKMFDKFMSMGVEMLDVKTPSGETVDLLNLATAYYKLDFITHLSNYININTVDGYGNTPLLTAINSNAEIDKPSIRENCVKKIIELGGDVNTQSNKTPLLWATKLGLDNIITILVENGAKVETSIEIAREQNLGQDVINKLQSYLSDDILV